LLRLFRDVRLLEDLRAVERLPKERFLDDERLRELLLEAGFFGTLAPLRRASDNPMAIACFLLLTFLPERPLFSCPCLNSCIDRLTLRCDVLPYLAMLRLSCQ
jgi:hypothetical protein